MFTFTSHFEITRIYYVGSTHGYRRKIATSFEFIKDLQQEPKIGKIVYSELFDKKIFSNCTRAGNKKWKSKVKIEALI
jgi:hypothetical protein